MTTLGTTYVQFPPGYRGPGKYKPNNVFDWARGGRPLRCSTRRRKTLRRQAIRQMRRMAELLARQEIDLSDVPWQESPMSDVAYRSTSLPTLRPDVLARREDSLTAAEISERRDQMMRRFGLW